MTEMYKRIKELCEENNMTVSQMCKELSITRSCLSELSKGRTERLSAENSTKIANRFGVSVQYLISGREEDFDTKLKYARTKCLTRSSSMQKWSCSERKQSAERLVKSER